MSEELKPCPFCRRKAVRDLYGTRHCVNCGAAAYVTQWNTRPREEELAHMNGDYMKEFLLLQRRCEKLEAALKSLDWTGHCMCDIHEDFKCGHCVIKAALLKEGGEG